MPGAEYLPKRFLDIINNPGDYCVDMLNEYKEFLKWNLVSLQCSSEALEYFEDKIDWEIASDNRNLTLELIERHEDSVNYNKIATWNNETYFELYHDKIDFCYASVCRNSSIPIEILRKYQNEVNWDAVQEWAGLDIIIEFNSRFDLNQFSGSLLDLMF